MAKETRRPNKKLRITIVGPYSPYRGGIAQYNDMFYPALCKYADISVVSFKRLYPKFLYPGNSDKELGAKFQQDEKISYIIDACSPISLNRAMRKIVNDQTDVVLITWWTLFWQPGLAYVANRLRKRGIKVIYICHNIYDHDSNRLVQKLSRNFLGQADGYIVHSTDEKKRLKDLYGHVSVLNTGTLPINNNYPSVSKMPSKRGRLEILFFGFIRPYKGLDTLVDALKAANDKDIYLTIAGESWKSTEPLINTLRESHNPNIELRIGYVTDKQAAAYFARADIVILPYKSATGSGVASLAFSFDKPVLGASVGGLKDVITSGKTGWLVEPDSPEALARVIKNVTRAEAKKMQKYVHEFAEAHSVDALAQQMIYFVENVVSSS